MDIILRCLIGSSLNIFISCHPSLNPVLNEVGGLKNQFNVCSPSYIFEIKIKYEKKILMNTTSLEESCLINTILINILSIWARSPGLITLNGSVIHSYVWL